MTNRKSVPLEIISIGPFWYVTEERKFRNERLKKIPYSIEIEKVPCSMRGKCGREGECLHGKRDDCYVPVLQKRYPDDAEFEVHELKRFSSEEEAGRYLEQMESKA